MSTITDLKWHYHIFCVSPIPHSKKVRLKRQEKTFWKFRDLRKEAMVSTGLRPSPRPPLGVITNFTMMLLAKLQTKNYSHSISLQQKHAKCFQNQQTSHRVSSFLCVLETFFKTLLTMHVHQKKILNLAFITYFSLPRIKKPII